MMSVFNYVSVSDDAHGELLCLDTHTLASTNFPVVALHPEVYSIKFYRLRYIVSYLIQHSINFKKALKLSANQLHSSSDSIKWGLNDNSPNPLPPFSTGRRYF